MKKLIWISAVVLFVVSAGRHGNLFAETTGPVQAGVAASVKGEVKTTTPPEKAAHFLKDGDPIFMGDKIETGAEGQLQIQLLDQTFFTLGPLSSIIVDEFIYDPRNAGAKASVVKGILRAVSGKVAQKNPEDTPNRSGPDTVKGDPGASSPEVQDDAPALAELGNAIDAADTPATRGNKSSEGQKQQT
ncbi:MAG: hypothetical protein V1673_04475 [Candidatus Omnitrophota bacterium]